MANYRKRLDAHISPHLVLKPIKEAMPWVEELVDERDKLREELKAVLDRIEDEGALVNWDRRVASIEQTLAETGGDDNDQATVD